MSMHSFFTKCSVINTCQPLWPPDLLPYRFRLQVLFLLVNTLHIAQVNVICLATILEAVDATAQYTPLTLTIDLENFIVKVLDEFAERRGLFRVDILAPEDRVTS